MNNKVDAFLIIVLFIVLALMTFGIATVDMKMDDIIQRLENNDIVKEKK